MPGEIYSRGGTIENPIRDKLRAAGKAALRVRSLVLYSRWTFSFSKATQAESPTL